MSIAVSTFALTVNILYHGKIEKSYKKICEVKKFQKKIIFLFFEIPMAFCINMCYNIVYRL